MTDTDINFVRDDYMQMRAWSWLRMLDVLFDRHRPQGYRFSTFTERDTLAHLMHRAGLFASVGDARRNGWNKPVPAGYSDYVVGKDRRRITVVNVYDGIDDHACNFIFCRCGTQRGLRGRCPFEISANSETPIATSV